ncbi:MAG: hypothetical protein IPM45_14965 [Acidimicrobiales bacterium]|nr:hypothetical protein [Acidimicrobiales bacterium]
MRILVPALVALAVLAGTACDETTTTTATTTTATTPRPAVAAGNSTGTLVHDGVGRTYVLHVPPQVADGTTGPTALVVALHGGFGSGAQLEQTSGFDAVADREGFVVAYPDGLALTSAAYPRPIRTWNGGRCCGPAVRDQVDDVGFVAGLVDDLTARLPVDPGRVFLVGHSNGAILSFRTACERPDLVAAIVPVAGSMEVAACTPAPGVEPRGVSALVLHGDADRNHPIGGGRGERSVAGIDFTSMAETLRRWTAAQGCPAPGPPAAAGALTTTTWAPCAGGTATQLTVIAGADHPWPGSDPDRRLSPLQGEPTQALDATEAAWAFLAAHGRAT